MLGKLSLPISRCSNSNAEGICCYLVDLPSNTNQTERVESRSTGVQTKLNEGYQCQVVVVSQGSLNLGFTPGYNAIL